MVDTSKHKIAIIINREVIFDYSDYQDVTKKIVDSITNWEEVTGPEYEELLEASGRMGFLVLEQPVNFKEFSAKTITEFKKLVDRDNKQREKLEKIAAEKAKARKEKKMAKTIEAKKKLLEQLQEELKDVCP